MNEEDLKSKARETWGRTRSLGDDAGVERGPFLNRNLQRVVTQLALNPKLTRRTGGYLPPYLKNPPKTNASTEETGMNKIYERMAELILAEAGSKRPGRGGRLISRAEEKRRNPPSLEDLRRASSNTLRNSNASPAAIKKAEAYEEAQAARSALLSQETAKKEGLFNKLNFPEGNPKLPKTSKKK